MKVLTAVFLLMISAAFIGCESGEEEIRNQAALEGAAVAGEQIAAENENLARRAAEMEADLQSRQHFFQALSGTFEGDLATGQGVYRIRITLVSSLPPYRTPRTRLPEEIASDLNSLHLNAQVVQWNEANPLSAVGCRVTEIHPDLMGGEIVIASENCPNLYALRIAGEGLSSQEIATQITSERRDHVGALSGSIQPSTNAAIYHFTAVRTP